MNYTGIRVTLVPIFHSDDLFGNADEVERSEIERLFVEQTFRFDEMVFERRREASIWSIVSGSAVYSRCTSDGEPSVVRIARPGEVFGLTETLARIPFDASLRTISSFVCRRMDHESFVGIFQRRPPLRQRVLAVLAEKYCTALANAANARAV